MTTTAYIATPSMNALGSIDQPIPQEESLHGSHRDHLPYQGTFFRRWLGDATSPAYTLANAQFFDVWGLWRPTVENTEFAPIWRSRGGSCFAKEPHSTSKRVEFAGEIDEVTLIDCRRTELIWCWGAASVAGRSEEVVGRDCFVVPEVSGEACERQRFEVDFSYVPTWTFCEPIPESTLPRARA